MTYLHPEDAAMGSGSEYSKSYAVSAAPAVRNASISGGWLFSVTV